MRLTIKKFFTSYLLIFLLTIGAFLYSGSFQQVYAGAQLGGGDFFQVFNNTTQEGTWRDPVSGQPGEIIEFRVMVRNTGDQVAERVQVWGSITGQVPQDPALQHVVTAKIHSPTFGAGTLTDTATINVLGGVPQGMRFVEGHSRINGVTNLYNCLPNPCDIPDSGVLGGIEVGNIQPGDFVELTFKAGLTNVLTPTPTVTTAPSPTPTGVPTATPTGVPTATPTTAPTVTPAPQGSGVQCPAGFIQTISGSNILCLQQIQSQSQQQSASANASTGPISVSVNAAQALVATATPTVTPTPQATPAPVGTSQAVPQVQQLPKTGLPLLAWALGGFLPIGAGLKRFGFKGKAENVETPQTIWTQREFER